DPRHVQVMIDGVSLNNLSDNVADIGSIPVQQIQRIEIVKGPASSSWGSALGGIINIITKSPDPDRKAGGMVSASIGERNTGDYRGELSGTVGRFGYYIYGGGLTGDGLTPSVSANKGDLYTKLTWQGSDKARLQFSLAYNNGTRTDGQDVLSDLKIDSNFEYFFSTLSFSYAISDNLSFDVSGRVSKRKNNQFVNALDSGAELQRFVSDELDAGGSAKLVWRSGMQSLVVGSDYDNGAMDSPSILDGRQKQVRWAVFANGTLSRWNFALIPGVRYDHTSTSGSFVSPSVGLTYTLLEKTIFRGYVARGFNTPSLGATFGDGFFSIANPGLQAEKVWSYSLGVETAALKYLWIKATGFQHDISDVMATQTLATGNFNTINSGKQRRRGVEAELKTLPLYNTSLMAGYTYLEVTDRQTGQRIQNFPTWTLDTGVDYAYGDLFRGALRGHYIWWNADPTAGASYHAMIWDLNLSSRVVERGDNAVELFFTAHNLFNGSQYSFGLFPNPRRWFEGGVKCRF
ncbi:MAG TPA: TonB-dependent receptor, partial [Geobacteraceae bacterium]